jgi:hypothetical protein
LRRADAPPRRLEELNEQRTSQVARLKLVERDREALEGGKAEAEACMEKEAKLLRSRCTLFQLFLGEAQGNVAKIEANKGELEAKLAHERCVSPPFRKPRPGRLRAAAASAAACWRSDACSLACGCAARSTRSTRPRWRRRRLRTTRLRRSTRR